VDQQLLSQVERWFHRGEFGRVVFTCDTYLRNPQYATVRAELLFWKGNAQERAGRAWHGEAISCFREGIAAATRDRPLKARLIAALGNMYSLTGDCASFEKVLREYERLARTKQSRILRWGAFVWYNYGVTLDNALRWQDAATAYTKAAVLAEEFGWPGILGQALHNLGGVQLLLGRLPEAAATMAQAEALLPDESAGHKKLSRRAEFFLAAGDLVSAQQMITAALVHPLVDDRTRADVYFTWAHTLRSLGRQAECQDKAMLALEFAVKAVHYTGVHKLNRFLQELGGQQSVS